MEGGGGRWRGVDREDGGKGLTPNNCNPHQQVIIFFFKTFALFVHCQPWFDHLTIPFHPTNSEQKAIILLLLHSLTIILGLLSFFFTSSYSLRGTSHGE